MFSIQSNISITNIEVKLIGDNLMMIYKANLMNSKPCLMNLTSKFIININSFESNLKILIMKKLLQLLLLLSVFTTLAQAPFVANPTQVSSTIKSITLSTNIIAYGTADVSLLVSTSPFFTDPLTIREIPSVGGVNGSNAVTVNYTIDCLKPQTTFYVKVKATNANGTTTSGYTTMTTNSYSGVGVNTLQALDIDSNSALLRATLFVPSGVTDAYAQIYYGTNQTNLNYAILLPGFTTGTNIVIDQLATNGLSPNTTYYAYLELNHSSGAVCYRSEFISFTTPPAASLLYHFPFNNSYSSVTSNPGTFTSTQVAPFVPNQSASASAMRVVVGDNDTSRSTNAPSASLPLLPVGGASRSIVYRVRFVTLGPSSNFVFSYGTASSNQAFGVNNTALTSTFYAWSNDISYNPSFNTSNWYTIAVVYNGANIKHYVNGVFVQRNFLSNSTLNTIGTIFNIGKSPSANFGYGNFDIDDLRIYSGVLTPTEISSLHNNLLSSTDFNNGNLKLKLYPNPANNIVNIAIESELKIVEIYTLQGQKVMSTNQKEINFSQLNTGIYLVKVEDENGAIATQKIIKN